jgi:hypothetical protein
LVRTSEPLACKLRHGVGYRRSPGNLASAVTRLIGWSRMPLWSAMVVSSQAYGSRLTTWMQTMGTILVTIERCSLVRVSMPAQGGRGAHRLLYLAAVRWAVARSC